MTSPRPYPFETQFAAAWPLCDWFNSHVLLAVSGGADSVAMLRAAATLKASCGGNGQLFVAHLNHRLRGEESDADAAWLESICRKLDISLEVGKTDVAAIAAEQGDGLEAAARLARYDFLRQTAEKLGARFVAVAHTADDQVETVLHRILRGSGLAGLAGMPVVRPLSPSVTLVRPLLAMRRRDVLDYLNSIGQDFRTDSSNSDPRWTRNRLRHELLPLLRESYNADVDAAFMRLVAQAAESQQWIVEAAANLAHACVSTEFAEVARADNERITRRVRIDCRSLSTQPTFLVREVCKIAWTQALWPQQAMGFGEWQQLAEMVRGAQPLPPINLPGNVQAFRDGHALILQAAGLP